MIHPLAFLDNLMGMDGLVVLVIGLLIFGRRLPEVGENLGKTIVEFKRGLTGTADDKDNSLEDLILIFLVLSVIVILIALLLFQRH